MEMNWESDSSSLIFKKETKRKVYEYENCMNMDRIQILNLIFKLSQPQNVFAGLSKSCGPFCYVDPG